MGFDVVAAYILGIVGLAIAVVVGWITHSRDINTRLAIEVMLKCLREGKVDRARKFCMSAPGSFFDAIHAAIVAGTTVASTERTVLESVVFPAFEETRKTLLRRRKARIELGVVGIFLVAAAVGLAVSSAPLQAPMIVIAGLGVSASIYLWRRSPRMAEALTRARAEVVPAIVDAIIQGEPPKTESAGPFRTASKPIEPPPVPTPARAKPGTSLRDGECPLCKNTKITRIDLDDTRFHKLVCASCGYTQEFADLAQID